MAEFGSRRAQGADGAILGARASYIAGCSATACTMADQHYGSPATGTMAHSWVQMFPDEYTAFKTYCQLYPNNATLLVDTYNVLQAPACPTPSVPSRRCWSPWASPSAASGWTPAT